MQSSDRVKAWMVLALGVCVAGAVSLWMVVKVDGFG